MRWLAVAVAIAIAGAAISPRRAADVIPGRDAPGGHCHCHCHWTVTQKVASLTKLHSCIPTFQLPTSDEVEASGSESSGGSGFESPTSSGPPTTPTPSATLGSYTAAHRPRAHHALQQHQAFGRRSLPRMPLSLPVSSVPPTSPLRRRARRPPNGHSRCRRGFRHTRAGIRAMPTTHLHPRPHPLLHPSCPARRLVRALRARRRVAEHVRVRPGRRPPRTATATGARSSDLGVQQERERAAAQADPGGDVPAMMSHVHDWIGLLHGPSQELWLTYEHRQTLLIGDSEGIRRKSCSSVLKALYQLLLVNFRPAARKAWIFDTSINGFLGLNSARMVAILGAQGLAHHHHGRRVPMKSHRERSIRAYTLGMLCQNLLFVGVHDIADPSGGEVARRFAPTERRGDVFLERDAFTAATDGEMNLEFLGRHFDRFAVFFMGRPVCGLAFAILHRVEGLSKRRRRLPKADLRTTAFLGCTGLQAATADHRDGDETYNSKPENECRRSS
ncbi:hypothetical protein GGX14DRAFT_667980 [Mycena pura]|uniref:Uncharacterized protein n=1 Tax=Mycena pura TaxID=153505 RepID=A0AAD6UYE3_9AGAR|nr:hypothetical protein GGX14DRAFT_667980 [Mycena pura]